jgi:hypothetical protein
MARKVFYSFHYIPDAWRASQVRNMGIIEGNQPVSDNDWETVKRGGDAAIAKWIAGQMFGRSCTIVLVGQNTAGRKWITHEIIESWKARMGVVGIRIHRLKDHAGNTASIGGNPFDSVNLGEKPLSSIVKLYDPPYIDSKDVYAYIQSNMSKWVEEAITIRGKY